MDELAKLRVRVDRLEGERGVADLLARYAQSLDYGIEDEWLDCFTEDATFDIRFVGSVDAERFPRRAGTETPDGLEYHGRESLTQFVRHHTNAPEVFHKHFALGARVVVHGDTATSVSYLVRLDIDEDGILFTRAFGRYTDECVRGDDGVWRFRKRLAEPEAMDLRELRRHS